MAKQNPHNFELKSIQTIIFSLLLLLKRLHTFQTILMHSLLFKHD